MSTHLEHDDKKDAAHDYTQQVTPADAVPSSDVEDVEVKSGLKRNLKSRHMAMISLGGVIGTGLFLGTGSALANGGPLGLFLGYATMGSICYCVMVGLFINGHYSKPHELMVECLMADLPWGDDLLFAYPWWSYQTG